MSKPPLWVWVDFDGVVASRTTSRSQLVSKVLGIPAVVCRRAYLDQLQTDPHWKSRSLAVTTLPDEMQLYQDVFTGLAREYNRPLAAETISQLTEDFVMTNRFQVMPGWQEFAEAMKGVAYLGLLSNAYPSRRQVELPELDLEFDFDDIILSCEVGLEKPEPAIYELAIQRSGQIPNQNWMVDNLPSNLQRPDAVGFGRTILFRAGSDWPRHVGGFTELERMGMRHIGPNSITSTQQRLFRELAASGRANR